MNAYEILGVSVHASEEEIHAAYIRLATLNHPDRGGDVDAFRDARRAYEQLTSAETRVEVGVSASQPVDASQGDVWIPPMPPRSRVSTSTYRDRARMGGLPFGSWRQNFAFVCMIPMAIVSGGMAIGFLGEAVVSWVSGVAFRPRELAVGVVLLVAVSALSSIVASLLISWRR